MQDLKITLVQTDLVWEDKKSNLDRLSEKLNPLKGKQDIIVLPEMFSTGFTMNAGLAEDENGICLKWLRERAGELGSAITGSMIWNEGAGLKNRLIFMPPDGNFSVADKKHLFRFGNEHQHFTPGDSRLIVSFRGWKICLLVCYDLRFPVWSRNSYDQGTFAYDLLLYTANWPAARSHHWKTLLVARAIENLAYTAGVNRVGEDGRGTAHSGDSLLSDPRGNILKMASSGAEEIITLTLDARLLSEYRAKFNVALDWDQFEILS